MKYIWKVLLMAMLVVGACEFTACKKKKSLSQLRREERESIKRRLKGEMVVTEIPADSMLLEGVWYKDSEGLYIRITTRVPEEWENKPQKGDEIVVNYYEITLDGDTILRQWSPAEYSGNAPRFYYDQDYLIEGFNIATHYMRTNEVADLILPSEIGSVDAMQTFTALEYKYRIKIR